LWSYNSTPGNWYTHIFSKRKQLGLSLTKMYWLLGRDSKLSKTKTKLHGLSPRANYTDRATAACRRSYCQLLRILIYKVILKPIWIYGFQLWGTTSNSNITILERFQSKVLRLIVDAPWYVSNSVIRKDLRIPAVKEEISRFSSLYVFASVYTPMNSLPHSPSRQSTGVCVDTGPTTCLSDSSNLY
jgi:hypothetical protein